MEINDTLSIPDEELQFSYARSGGPGGQNVNKVSSKAILHWNLEANATLPAEVKERLRAQQRQRLTTEGELVIQSQAFRDQAKNVEACRVKLREMIEAALHVPKTRKATKPSKASKRRRLDAKRQNSARKAGRRDPSGDD